jgi:hypothetical protein
MRKPFFDSYSDRAWSNRTSCMLMESRTAYLRNTWYINILILGRPKIVRAWHDRNKIQIHLPFCRGQLQSCCPGGQVSVTCDAHMLQHNFQNSERNDLKLKEESSELRLDNIARKLGYTNCTKTCC